MHLLLVGGGHATLPALQHASRFRDLGVRVTLLSDSRHLYYSGMVPEYLGGVYAREEVRIDLAAMCHRTGVGWIEAEATGLDAAARVVTTASGDAYRYDLAALCIGARNPNPQSAAILTKPINRIEALEEAIRRVMATPPERWRLVVVGGGAAGVEVALNVTARFHAAHLGDVLRLTLLEPAGRLLSRFPPRLSAYTRQLLEQRGATVRTGTPASAATPEAVILESGERLPADDVLWATGSTAPPLFREAGLPVDDRGFVRVRPTLQVEEHPRLFAAGDCIALGGHEDLAKVGVHAVKEGPVLLENLARRAQALREGRAAHEASLRPFRPYPLAPLILSTGAREGLWTSGPLWVRGDPVLRLKHLVDRRWMRKYHPAWQRPLWHFLDAAHALGC